MAPSAARRRLRSALEAIRRAPASANAAPRDAATETPAPESPFWHYYATFEAVPTILRHARDDLVPDPRYLTNFLGVRIDPKFLPSILEGRAGEVEPPPIPANWHADIAEWAAALRAVDLAGDTFTMAELGCGWACWMNNTGVAARTSGRAARVIGVEGDPDYIQFAREACAANGFSAGDVKIVRGIAAPRTGRALFPRQDVPGEQWGLEPILDPSEDDLREAEASDRYDILETYTIADILLDDGRLDLLHVDIQGGEADLLSASRDMLDEHVAYLLVGTHSREIEGRLFATFTGTAWALEVERPAIITPTPAGPVTTVDGVQAWRNTALLPA